MKPGAGGARHGERSSPWTWTWCNSRTVWAVGVLGRNVLGFWGKTPKPIFAEAGRSGKAPHAGAKLQQPPVTDECAPEQLASGQNVSHILPLELRARTFCFRFQHWKPRPRYYSNTCTHLLRPPVGARRAWWRARWQVREELRKAAMTRGTGEWTHTHAHARTHTYTHTHCGARWMLSHRGTGYSILHRLRTIFLAATVRHSGFSTVLAASFPSCWLTREPATGNFFV
jgi:hypothetical protein